VPARKDDELRKDGKLYRTHGVKDKTVTVALMSDRPKK